jgi:hypothetical protein
VKKVNSTKSGEVMFPRLQQPLSLVDIRWNRRRELLVTVRYAAGTVATEIIGRHIIDIMSAPIILAESETFEILFPRCFTYMVSDELCFPPDDNEIFEGGSFRRYQKSRFLDFIEKSAYSDDVRPSPLFHYGIYCQDDLVDIVTPQSPQISFIGMTSR